MITPLSLPFLWTKDIRDKASEVSDCYMNFAPRINHSQQTIRLVIELSLQYIHAYGINEMWCLQSLIIILSLQQS